MMLRPGEHHVDQTLTKDETASFGGKRPVMASQSRFGVERRPPAIAPSVCAAV